MTDGPLNFKIIDDQGNRCIETERDVRTLRQQRDKLVKGQMQLAKQQQMLAEVLYEPPDDADALECYRRAQRQAAAMSTEVLQELRKLMLTAFKDQVRLDAAKALWEIGSRIGGGSGKAGTLPGTNVLIIDKTDFDQEMQKRKKDGKL